MGISKACHQKCFIHQKHRSMPNYVDHVSAKLAVNRNSVSSGMKKNYKRKGGYNKTKITIVINFCTYSDGVKLYFFVGY